MLSPALAQGVLHAVTSELLVVVDEGEGQVDVERVGPVRGCRPLARLKGNHEVHPSSWPLDLELVDEVLAEDLTQELLELVVDPQRTVGSACGGGGGQVWSCSEGRTRAFALQPEAL